MSSCRATKLFSQKINLQHKYSLFCIPQKNFSLQQYSYFQLIFQDFSKFQYNIHNVHINM